MYKNLVQGTTHANNVFKNYQHLKKKYKIQLTVAKKLACQNYIESSGNKHMAVWEESSFSYTQRVSFDPNIIVFV